MHAAIERYIAANPPSSLLECSPYPWPDLELFCTKHAIGRNHLQPEQITTAQVPEAIAGTEPAELAIVHHCLENLPASAGQQLLGSLRNRFAQRVWLILPTGTEWTLPRLIAMGFKKDQSALVGDGLESYTYDIRSYNHKREWNNPRFWANPENFNKYRW
jgi:hypothetical protein